MILRPAKTRDLAALYRLEQVAFSGDRFSRRQLWHLLNRANALTLVAEAADGRLLGYGTLLFRHGSGRARLYSFCVHPEARGGGLGRRMLQWLEDAAGRRGCDWLVLEVRADNTPALALYHGMGFAPSDWLGDYYEDGCAGWRMVKPLGLAQAG
ncbi:GNAT family N-acetyltransferase [Halomonas sp. M4R1S46]|uniref:GNAT family N-acetyltransferase n=1 Tax=Halomonas sp. M4R1S46 TaxID=2982692 RepID=UPI0021E4AE0C|nr:GNAT family N-acetyltransferase [Halomonas sp. M4R1S46]UYG08552.1 GNAT family N-acetyltransferase [Halomonas sp. M4R1S46]